MSEAQLSEAIKNLVIFMIGFAIAGTVIALAWYFAIDLPVQHAALLPPANFD